MRPQIDMERHLKMAALPRFDPDGGVSTIDDPRGLIESICHEHINSILRIFSKAGSIRSNHYHLTDSHTIYVVTGCMDYFERPAASQEQPSLTRFRAGQFVRTAPLMEHTTVFLEDTEILVFASNHRDQDSYEADLVHTQDLSAV